MLNTNINLTLHIYYSFTNTFIGESIKAYSFEKISNNV